jgi:selenide,water dikinase
MIDYGKRKRIMGRSLKLGHCICNPREACPCEIFKQKNVCLCAGEREEDAAEDVELTKLVEHAGCASKIGQDDLKKALAGLPEISDPRVLVSSRTCDDAGVYKLSERLALVQSVDVFTPVVDDAYMFGQIAASNSVSDIYAMGGKPLTALSIIAFPIEKLSHRVMNKMLQGGIDKLKEAGVVLLGGHSIKDREVKLGFAVTGIINPSRIITNSNAEPGDVLILTKPLGTGVVSFARQLGKAPASALEAAGLSMIELNKAASEVMTKMNVRTATDVTGFGLAGHLGEMVIQSRVSAEVWVDCLPVFDGVMDLLSDNMISGAVERNREFASTFVECAGNIGEALETIVYDPQTSGGLLISVVEKRSGEMLKELKDRGVKYAAVIGRIGVKPRGRVLLRRKPRA